MLSQAYDYDETAQDSDDYSDDFGDETDEEEEEHVDDEVFPAAADSPAAPAAAPPSMAAAPDVTAAPTTAAAATARFQAAASAAAATATAATPEPAPAADASGANAARALAAFNRMATGVMSQTTALLEGFDSAEAFAARVRAVVSTQAPAIRPSAEATVRLTLPPPPPSPQPPTPRLPRRKLPARPSRRWLPPRRAASARLSPSPSLPRRIRRRRRLGSFKTSAASSFASRRVSVNPRATPSWRR